jgi:hypothetical protein
MEIIRKFSIAESEFVVLKSFFARTAGELKSRPLKVNEIVRFDPNKTPYADIIGWCHLKKIAAVNLPDPGIYKAKGNFRFRIGGKQLIEVGYGEIIEMRAIDAWPLLLANSIEPGDDTTWTPVRVMPRQKRL